MTNPSLHRHILTAYADEKDMLIRKRTHELYTIDPKPHFDFAKWVLERFAWQGNEYVLDLGSGPGTYTPNVLDYVPLQQYVAIDISPGMLKAAQRQFRSPLVLGDAESIPFPDNFFDVVLANHMLYHVGDVDRAIEEIHRVLRPSGILLAATNSLYTMPEFNTLIQRTFRLLGQPISDSDSPEQSFLKLFSLETGASRLARHFNAVARYDLPGVLSFNEAQPVIDYINSVRPFYELFLPEGMVWEDFMSIMVNQVRRLVSHFGELVVNKLSGVLVATEAGGFAESYIRLMQELDEV